MGRNKSRRIPAAAIRYRHALAAAGKRSDFAPGKFYAFDANAVIRVSLSSFGGAHSGIRRLEVL